MGRSERDERHKRTRSRSKSPRDKHRDSKKKSRSRSPSHKSHRSSHRDRSERDRDSRDKRKRSRRSGSQEPKTIEEIVGGEVSLENFDIESQQKKLEILMQQRRERVEKWRLEQATRRGETLPSKDVSSGDKHNDSGTFADGSTEDKADEKENDEDNENDENEEKKKGWTLEDEDDEEDDGEQDMDIDDEDDERELLMPKKVDDDEDDKIQVKSSQDKVKTSHKPILQIDPEPKEGDEDVDPLEAYMQEVQAEVQKLKGKIVKEEKPVGSKAQLVVGVAKKNEDQDDNKKRKRMKEIKGELLEQNQDAMEYSSEEDATTAEDLAQMNSNLNQSKMKKIQSVTLADISYRPFRKNFYIEVPELANMTKEDVDEYRESLEGIKVKGKNCPKPIKSWPQAGLSRRIMEVLKKQTYEKPTPIQAQAIPAIMSGRDLIGIAKTGSGKTLAFLLPMFRHILDQDPLDSGEGPIAVIMTPTRELATQIWAECRKFAKSLGLRTVAVYGGTPISEQIGELKPGAEIVVCTPGRMIDMLAANNGRVTNLKRCTYMVLDEADRMFDMGFEPQVMRILDGLRPDRQTVMFSATFPRVMEALARRALDKPIEVIVGGRSVVAKEVEQNVVIVNEEDHKFLKLLEILGRHIQEEEKTAIVFVDKQESADSLLKDLLEARYTCLALHGGIDQTDRDSTISAFKQGMVKVLIATSVAARGLDVRHCVVVVNYDCPNHYEDYVHRCGRTGRAGTKGVAYTFLTLDQGRYAGDIIKAFELSDMIIPEDVKNLFEIYKMEQAAMGKTVKSGGGFSGKGFKFDESENQQAADKKKQQKATLGLQDSDDDEEDETDLDDQIIKMLAPKQTIKQLSAPVVHEQFAADPVAATHDKLEAARRLNAMLTQSMNPSSSNTTQAFMRGELPFGVSSVIHAKSIADQMAERLNAKLKYIPKDVEYDADGERIPSAPEPLIAAPGNDGFQRFEMEVIINDFPQQARWRVTSREALAQISEYSDAGLTVRGTYYDPKVKIPEGERKLYIAIEGSTELSVSKAYREILRILKDELTKLKNSNQPMNKGRYKVV